VRESTKFIDLSHEIERGLVTYPGLPAPIICDYLSREHSREHYAPGTEFQIGRIDMVGNTGTYVDSPFHRFASGKSLAELPLESLAEIPAVVVRPKLNSRAINATHFEKIDCAGRAVLVQTGWSRHWATEDYFVGHPFLTEDAARFLRDCGSVLVGIDSLNIDSTDDGQRPVHTTLLGAGIPICEHLCGLEGLPEDGFKFSAVPVKIKSFGTFPVRAYATLARVA
jgi:arylformamidase